jgi:hypothetical protein
MNHGFRDASIKKDFFCSTCGGESGGPGVGRSFGLPDDLGDVSLLTDGGWKPNVDDRDGVSRTSEGRAVISSPLLGLPAYMVMKTKPLPAKAYLDSRYHYDPETGLLTHTRTEGGVVAGSRVGSNFKGGYLRTRVGGSKTYPVHRLIWRMMTGEDPGEMEVDHRNENKADNRWCNLRLATGGQNRLNVSRHRRNKSGIKGVHWIPKVRKWKASVNLDGKLRYLGLFTTAAEAEAVVRAFRDEHHGDFVNHGLPPTEEHAEIIRLKDEESRVAEEARRTGKCERAVRQPFKVTERMVKREAKREAKKMWVMEFGFLARTAKIAAEGKKARESRKNEEREARLLRKMRHKALHGRGLRKQEARKFLLESGK